MLIDILNIIKEELNMSDELLAQHLQQNKLLPSAGHLKLPVFGPSVPLSGHWTPGSYKKLLLEKAK